MAVETIKQFFGEVIPASMEKAPDKWKAINATYKFDIADEGLWVLNCTEALGLTEGDGEAKCTVKISGPDFLKLINGQAQGPQLFMMGRLKVQGDMGLALKLQKVFDAIK